MKKRYSIAVRGRQHEWHFHFDGDPQHVKDWEDDGLDVVEIIYSVPGWLPHWLTRPWCFAQDVFHMRNPFA